MGVWFDDDRTNFGFGFFESYSCDEYSCTEDISNPEEKNHCKLDRVKVYRKLCSQKTRN